MIIAISAAPVGVFLMLRRMSLSGDAMAHAILPGAGVGFLLAGLRDPADDAWRVRGRADRGAAGGAGVAADDPARGYERLPRST